MTSNEIQELIRDINKRNPDNNSFFTAINLTNVYLSKFFTGTEHELLKKIYAKHLFVYLWEYCNEPKNFKKKNIDSIFEKFLQQIRINTYSFRKKCLIEWINCTTEKKISNCELVQALSVFYKINKLNTVRKLLGLNYLIG